MGGHSTRGTSSNLEILQKSKWGTDNGDNKEVGVRVSPRGSQAFGPRGAPARDQAGPSARALISAFYVLKMLHLQDRVFSCSLSLAGCLRVAEKTRKTPLVSNMTFYKNSSNTRKRSL